MWSIAFNPVFCTARTYVPQLRICTFDCADPSFERVFTGMGRSHGPRSAGWRDLNVMFTIDQTEINVCTLRPPALR